jgi:hypothetical protein
MKFKMIYVLRWWPSWISDRHNKHTPCRGPSNDHSWVVWFQLYASSLKPLGQLNPNYPGMIIGRYSTRCAFFMPSLYRTIQWTFMYSLALIIFVVSEIHRLTLDPMGKCSNAFFSETTNMIKAKLYKNVHWIRNKKRKICRGPSNEHSCTVWL